MRRALYLALARCAWGKQMIDKHAAARVWALRVEGNEVNLNDEKEN